MKNSDKCCKCSSKRIMVIPPMYLVESTRVRISLIGDVPPTLYVCGDCGYSETWFEGDYLKAINKRATKKGWYKEN